MTLLTAVTTTNVAWPMSRHLLYIPCLLAGSASERMLYFASGNVSKIMALVVSCLIMGIAADDVRPTAKSAATTDIINIAANTNPFRKAQWVKHGGHIKTLHVRKKGEIPLTTPKRVKRLLQYIPDENRHEVV